MKKNKLSKEQKDFIKSMYNYAILLCFTNDTQSINELCQVIKYQNERREKK